MMVIPVGSNRVVEGSTLSALISDGKSLEG
jgi:hypothetical protein